MTLRRPAHWAGFVLAFLLAALLVPGGTAAAEAEVPLELEGRIVQGGLVVGRTAPDARVRFDGEPVRVSPEGVFLVGFGRDAPETETLVIELPDGRTLERRLDVARRDYDIQRIDGVEPSKVTPPESVLPRIREEVRMVREARTTDAARTDFLQAFEWPVEGRITGVYGSQRFYNGEPRRPHYGIDIAAAAGTPVRAPAAGIVTLAHPDMYFSGGTLILDHGHGLSSAFLHLRHIDVEEGDQVNRGDVIATVGAGGRATGAHLDWRINLFDRRLDPAFLVEPMPGEAPRATRAE
jgi:murein DD-endopeptidase MepM/ murein hydrolase activator NlpD